MMESSWQHGIFGVYNMNGVTFGLLESVMDINQDAQNSVNPLSPSGAPLTLPQKNGAVEAP
jgi:hypothetical protein